MKLIFLLLFLCVASIAAQRRAPSVENTQRETTNPRAITRGRARFSQTTEYQAAAVPAEEYERTRSRTNRNQLQQRTKITESRYTKTTTTTEPDNIAKAYEVKETIDDTPPDFAPNRINSLPAEQIITDSNKVVPESPPSSTTTTTTTTSTQKSVGEIPETLKEDDRNLKTTRISDRRNSARSQRIPETSTTTNRRRSRNRNVNDVPSTTTTTTTTAITRPTRRSVRRRIIENTTGNPVITNSEPPRRSRTGRKIATNIPTTPVTTAQRTTHRRSVNLRQNFEQNNEILLSKANNRKNDDTQRSILRGRSRQLPPIFNESQLEVLPLFEREEELPKNRVESVTKTIKSRARPSGGQHASRQIIVKESVIAEFNEVTSRRTVTRVPRRRLESSTIDNRRRKTVGEDKKIKENLTKSAEEINESDNYPEPFKMLIQARKHNTAEPKVSTRTATSRSVQSTTPIPTKPPTKKPPFPRRFPSTTRQIKDRLTTTTAATSTRTTAKPEKFHTKINNLNYKNPEISTISSKPVRTLPTKRPRKLYSSKKNDEYEKRAPYSTQIPPSTSVRTNRYSSRYRKNLLSTGKRVGNTPPVYQPTVPTIRTTPAAKSMVEDKDLGLEVVTINDPIFTPPSANLVNSDYTNPDSDNQILVAEAQTKPTEKPKSLIEQIISSITAISTTPPPPPTATIINNVNSAAMLTTTDSISVETTRPTTILKLRTKKADKTDDKRTTTERPTTVIEKILNSLSAIQFEATTESNDIETTVKTTRTTTQQVGTDFNTITTPSVFSTPIGENLVYAPSTTVNTLDVLDTAEGILQQNTIDSLLELLRSLSPTTTTTTTDTTTQEASTRETPQQFESTSSQSPTTVPNQVAPETTIQPTTTTTTTNQNEISTIETNTQTQTTLLTTTELPTTIVPPFIRFEVSPGSVSVFSANDLSNTITTDDFPSTTTTVQISGRSNFQFGTSSSTSSSTNSLPLEGTTVSIRADTESSDNPTTTRLEETSAASETTISTVEQNSSEPANIPSTTFAPNPLSAITMSEAISQSTVTPAISTTEQSTFTTVTSEMTFSPLDPNTSTTELSTVSVEISSLEPNTPTTEDSFSTSEIGIATHETVTEIATTLVPNSLSPVTISESQPVVTSNTSEMSVTTLVPSGFTTEVASTTSELSSFTTTEVIPTTLEMISSISEQSASTTTEMSSSTTVVIADVTSTSESISQSIVNPLSNQPNQSNQGGFLNNNQSSPIGIKNRISGLSLESITEPINNSLEPSTPSTVSPNKDYFIFAVLNNNTVLRKRPSAFPNQNTPYLVVGVYPNNTIVRKFPNGTLVPMEPVIRDEPTTMLITADPLSINEPQIEITSSDVSSPAPTTLSNNNSEVTTQANNQGDSIPSLPALNEILNGNTVKAFESIINISDLNAQAENSKSRSTTTTSTTTTTTAATTSSITTIAATTTLPPPPPSTTVITTTREPLTDTELFTSAITTALPLSITIAPETTTTSSTTIPTIANTEPPTTVTVATTSSAHTTIPPTTVVPTISIPVATTTTIPITTTVATTEAPTTTTVATTEVPITTTVATTEAPTTPTTTITTTTAVPATTATVLKASATARANALQIEDNEISSTRSNPVVLTADAQVFSSPVVSSTKRPKQLTKQQLSDLQTLAKLEEEQAAILKQLAFLNRLNLVSQPITTQSPTDLANKIIALAVERSNQKDKSTTVSSIDDEKATADVGRAHLERLLSNIPKTTNIQSSFGKTNDAIIAELLKEQGITPTTPDGLGVIYMKTTIAPRITTTTTAATKKQAQPRAPLMQGLKWLLNAFNGPSTTTTQKPKTNKTKPKQKEILVNQPTRITPVVVTSPQPQPLSNSVSESDLQFLIKKLEAIQKDPQNTQLDLETQEKLQNLITGGGFDRFAPSPPPTTIKTARQEKQISTTKNPVVIRSSSTTSTTTTPKTTVVSNNILDDDDLGSISPATTTTKVTSTTAKPRLSLPPVQLNPVPGVRDDETLVRGQLISSAINVTRALTQFLGSALQGAAYNFQNLLGSSSRYIGTFARGSLTNSSVDPS